MALILTHDKILRFYVNQSLPSSVKFAIEDLRKDLSALSFPSTFISTPQEADVIVHLPDSVRFPHREEFFYRISKRQIEFFGADDLGLMWAIYTFSRDELGIPPFVAFEPWVIPQRSTLCLEEKEKNDFPRIKYRGWFINDEDLLEHFSSSGKRNINYRFYQEVISPELMNQIVETALRYRMNLLIPATLLNVLNPAEERLCSITASRGLYLSQHHIEPLGLSKETFASWADRHGLDPTFSYLRNASALRLAWKEMAEHWSRYPRVIFQLGLRGGTDRPVWCGASEKLAKERWGNLISQACQDQFQIVQEATGSRPLTSLTLWMEGAELLSHGWLKPPSKETILVYADVGLSQLFGDDFFSVSKCQIEEGAYRHVAYWNYGPHLLEGTAPEKMIYCHQLLHQTGRNAYSLLNLANIKEFTFSAYLDSEMNFMDQDFSLHDAIEHYSSFYFEPEDYLLFQQALHDYFSSFSPLSDRDYRSFCHNNDFLYHPYRNLSFPVCNLSDGYLCWFLRRPFEDNVRDLEDSFLASLSNGIEKARRALQEFEILQTKTKQPLAFRQKWKYPTSYWLALLQASQEVAYAIKQVRDAFDAIDGLEIEKHYCMAAEFIEENLNQRKEDFTGKWERWLDGDKKLNIPELAAFLREEGKRLCSYYGQKELKVQKENDSSTNDFIKAY